jgi:16S rRNA (guanine966-N2)-methyltransferase
MKDRVREAVFNVLGPAVAGKHVVDLFAGTGALGLEALSRGASHALFIEVHHPTAVLLRTNIADLGVAEVAEVVVGNVFLRARWQSKLSQLPWLVFCSPPYAFYVERAAEMLDLIGWLWGAAPPESLFVVESDDRFDLEQLPDVGSWDVRTYSPAVIAIGARSSGAAASQ